MSAIESVPKELLESLKSGKLLGSDVEADTAGGISLLTLKNEALFSYVNNLVLIAMAQLEDNQQVLENARKRAIEQRVVLEKGVKGLEAKISYQIDKALRAYRKSTEQAEAAQIQKLHNSDDSDDEDNDLTAFRPNVASLAAAAASDNDSEAEEHARKAGKYIAPKISATSFAQQERGGSGRKSRRRDFAMEEYLQEAGDAPVAEPSIGSTIMDHGRGGMRTERERRKDREIQEYEEDNFTRISNVSAKRARKDASQRQRDAMSKSFFGEDWGFLDRDNRSNGSNGHKKKRRKH